MGCCSRNETELIPGTRSGPRSTLGDGPPETPANSRLEPNATASPDARSAPPWHRDAYAAVLARIRAADGVEGFRARSLETSRLVQMDSSSNTAIGVGRRSEACAVHASRGKGCSTAATPRAASISIEDCAYAGAAGGGTRSPEKKRRMAGPDKGRYPVVDYNRRLGERGTVGEVGDADLRVYELPNNLGTWKVVSRHSRVGWALSRQLNLG